jgi:hypothetical protein
VMPRARVPHRTARSETGLPQSTGATTATTPD